MEIYANYLGAWYLIDSEGHISEVRREDVPTNVHVSARLGVDDDIYCTLNYFVRHEEGYVHPAESMPPEMAEKIRAEEDRIRARHLEFAELEEMDIVASALLKKAIESI